MFWRFAAKLQIWALTLGLWHTDAFPSITTPWEYFVWVHYGYNDFQNVVLGGTLKFWICHFFASNTSVSWSVLGVLTWSPQNRWVLLSNAWKLWNLQILRRNHWLHCMALTKIVTRGPYTRGDLSLVLAGSSWCPASLVMQHKRSLLHSSFHLAWNCQRPTARESWLRGSCLWLKEDSCLSYFPAELPSSPHAGARTQVTFLRTNMPGCSTPVPLHTVCFQPGCTSPSCRFITAASCMVSSSTGQPTLQYLLLLLALGVTGTISYFLAFASLLMPDSIAFVAH